MCFGKFNNVQGKPMNHRIVAGLGLLVFLGACGESTPPGDTVSGTQPGQTKPAEPDCDPYLRFCIKSQVSGAVTASGVSGFGGAVPCAEWAKGGAGRVLELPNMLPMGDKNKTTVALTRVGAYTAPGEFVLASTRQGTGPIPDVLPAVDTGERSFGEGSGSRATVKIEADGSGRLEATDLVETKAMHRTREPDPAARLNLVMTWTCKDIQ